MLEISKDTDLNLREIYGVSQKDKQKRFFVDIWEEKYSILKNEDVIIWISKKINKFKKSGKNLSKFSITTYLRPLQQYCDYNKVESPSELLKEEIDIRNKRVMDYLGYLLVEYKKEINNEITDVEKLKLLGFNKIPNKVTIINMIQSRIKSFYSARGANISDGIVSEKKGINRRELQLYKETIKRITPKLESPRYRLAVKLQTQLGLRIGDILEELPNDKYIIELFKHPDFPEDSTKQRYYIKDFQTTKKGIVINYLFFTEELSDMIRSIYNIKDLTQFKLSLLLKTKSGRPINKTDFLLRLKKAVKDLKIQENMKTHAFRKYFSSQVRKCREVDTEFKEHLMGHTAVNLSESYNNNLRDINWFYGEWIKLENLICVDCIIHDGTNEEIVKLREANIKLQGQMDIIMKDNIQLKENFDKIHECTTCGGLFTEKGFNKHMETCK